MNDDTRARVLAVVERCLGLVEKLLSIATEPEKPARDVSTPKRKILEAMRALGGPAKAREIARRAELSYQGSYFKAAFCELKRERVVYRPDPVNAEYALRDEAASGEEG